MCVEGLTGPAAEKLARIYDEELGPLLGARLHRLLLQTTLPESAKHILVVGCGTGELPAALLQRLPSHARVIAIDESPAMVSATRNRLASLPEGLPHYFLRTESSIPRLPFSDNVFDASFHSLDLRAPQRAEATLAELARVCVEGGRVNLALPSAGTYVEFYDVLREVLIKHDLHDALDRLDAHLATYPTHATTRAWMRKHYLRGEICHDEYQILFRSAREFFFSPLIEFGPLQAWKRIAGDGQELQDVFWHIKQAFEAYFGGKSFGVTVRLTALSGQKQASLSAEELKTSNLADPLPPPPVDVITVVKPATAPLRSVREGGEAATIDALNDAQNPLI